MLENNRLYILLTASALLLAPAASRPFAARADVPDFAVWNVEVMGSAYDFGTASRGGPLDPERLASLEPIRIAGTRNGTFSGAVVVESNATIRGLRARLDPAPPPAGREGAPMPGSDAGPVRIRYAVHGEAHPRAGLDKLLESPPDEVPPRDHIGRPSGRRAMAGVWVTVDLPAEAQPGLYHGTLAIEAEGVAPVSVPVELHVAAWTLPPPDRWQTWVEMIQSPDTLALEYDVPLWSEQHRALIARSFRLMRRVGSRVVYIPLLRGTNQGNAQAMVRWRRGADGALSPDFEVMEQYLDLAREHLGTPAWVVFQVWDAYLAAYDQRPTVNEDSPPYAQQQQRLAQRRWDEQQAGLTVTLIDVASGEVEDGHLPHYLEEGGDARWRPVFDALRRRMRARGLEERMALGMLTDLQPTQAEAAFLHEVSGGLPWVSHAHPSRTRGRSPPNQALRGVADIVYEAHAYHQRFQVNPDLGRLYGWQVPEVRAHLSRMNVWAGHPLDVRTAPAFNITGEQRGVGRIGADFWPVLRDARRGTRTGRVFARYPANHWRGLNIDHHLLAPGPDGAISTRRYENLVEGLQECEARIFIEQALTDADRRARLGDPLAERAQALLDDRQRALWRSTWGETEHLALLGTLGAGENTREPSEGIRQRLDRLGDAWREGQSHRDAMARMSGAGRAWFLQSDWRGRNTRLFELAAEVQRRLD